MSFTIFLALFLQKKSFQRGVSYVVANVAEFNEYTNEFLIFLQNLNVLVVDRFNVFQLYFVLSILNLTLCINIIIFNM